MIKFIDKNKNCGKINLSQFFLFYMTTNPFAALDKIKTTINLNEAYDKELKAINERRMMVNSWKNELKKIQKERNKRKYNGRD